MAQTPFRCPDLPEEIQHQILVFPQTPFVWRDLPAQTQYLILEKLVLAQTPFRWLDLLAKTRHLILESLVLRTINGGSESRWARLSESFVDASLATATQMLEYLWAKEPCIRGRDNVISEELLKNASKQWSVIIHARLTQHLELRVLATHKDILPEQLRERLEAPNKLINMLISESRSQDPEETALMLLDELDDPDGYWCFSMLTPPSVMQQFSEE